jgi:hypothetical protein
LRNGIFVNFADVNGGQADSLWYLQNQNPILPNPYLQLETALSFISSAAPIGTIVQMFTSSQFQPKNAPYQNVTTEAIIRVRSVAQKGYIVIPAPVQAMFLADTVTVNMNWLPLVSFIAAANRVIGDAVGNQWTTWGPGWRRGVRSFPAGMGGFGP